jgi:pimeloyl-ACP methyl ester carboxylesterase
MEPFLLTLSNGALVSGLACIPARTSTTPKYFPLIVGIHGATYSSQYFNASPAHTAASLSAYLGVPFVAIDRPGYRDSSALPPTPDGSTFFQEEGKYVHRYILPELWEKYGQPSGASTMILLGHSLGVSACVIVGALHSLEKGTRYPLGGVMISGRTITSAISKSQGEAQIAEARKVGYIEYPPGVKNKIMFGDPKLGLASDEILRISEEITQHGLVGEMEDRRFQWDAYWQAYARAVKMPVLAAIGERDGLFQASQRDLESFSSNFTNSSKVETVCIPAAPHCMEMSHWGSAWYLRCFGFAIECATSAALA